MSQKFGLGILCATILSVASWLYMQSKQTPTTAALPSMAGTVDATRFRSDAWYLPADTLLGFVEIPTGSLQMGSDPAVDSNAFANEQWSATSNQGTITLPAFYIGRYEVTVAQFRAFVEATQYKANTQALYGLADHPVAYVSWTDALAYSRWLETQMQQSSLTPTVIQQHLHEGWHVTIPTEAQWEKAARGVDGRIYPWGNIASREYANYASLGTTSVGNFACDKCAYGLADMSGNVWELTRSAYRPYPFDPSSKPNPQSDALFVMRGGSFSDAENLVRTAVRGGIDPGVRQPTIGFRVVVSGP